MATQNAYHRSVVVCAVRTNHYYYTPLLSPPTCGSAISAGDILLVPSFFLVPILSILPTSHTVNTALLYILPLFTTERVEWVSVEKAAGSLVAGCYGREGRRSTGQHTGGLVTYKRRKDEFGERKQSAVFINIRTIPPRKF